MDEQRSARQVADVLGTQLSRVFNALSELLVTTEQLLAAAQPTSTQLPALDPLAISTVQGDGLIVGAGYVAAPDALSDAKYWLQWWSDYDIPRTGQPQRLQVELDPLGELFRDYTDLPWFAVPAETDARHVTGPYVDYLCTDEYTLTFTIPVHAHGMFAGVVGADVYAHDVERLVSPHLGALGTPTALLNTAGRVVAASNSDRVTGDLVRRSDVANALRTPAPEQDCGDSRVYSLEGLPFAVVVGPIAA